MTDSHTDGLCVLCGARDVRELPDRHADNGVEYTLHACNACAGQFWTPFKNPGASWYEHDERYASRNADPILKPNEKHRGVMEFLRDTTGKVLDIGCGVGNFLVLARERGWECWGIDFDRDAIEAAKRTHRLDHVEVASLSEFIAAHPQERFDLAAFFDVFEHLDDHNAFLEEVRRVLLPNGKIALSVPYRKAWRWLMPADLPPRHLTRWEESSLQNILGRHGFSIVFQKRFPATLTFLIMKFRFRYGKWASFGLVGKAKQETVHANASKRGSASSTLPWKVRALHALAKAKDALLFGVPALIVWIALLPTAKRYTDIYLVAKVSEMPKN